MEFYQVNIFSELAYGENIKNHDKLNESIVFNAKEFSDFEFNNFSKRSSFEFFDDEDSTEISSILINLNITETEEKIKTEESFNNESIANDEILSILKKQPSTAKNISKASNKFKSFSTKNISKQIPLTGRLLFRRAKDSENNIAKALDSVFSEQIREQ